MRARPIRRATASTFLLAALVAVPVLLVVACNRRFGHASPLHGMDAPWRWTLDGARSWARRLTGDLDTSRELIDLFLRAGLVLAWICIAVLVATIVSEAAFQIRHGMPSSRQQNLLGIGWIGRMVATGLVALLPLASGSPALAAGPSMPRAAITALRIPASSRPTAPSDQPAPDAGWSRHTVQRGESVWSIAASLAGPDDVQDVAQQIVDANRGTMMTDGRRFTTPALIEPGWQLLVPAPARTAGAPAVPARVDDLPASGPVPSTGAPAQAQAGVPVPAAAPAAAPAAVGADGSAAAADVVPTVDAGRYEVVAGDSYWSITADHLADVTGGTASDHDVFVAMERLMADNAPLLGHADPRLILPGERLVLGELSGPAVTPLPVTPLPDATATPSPAPPTPATPSPVPPSPVPPEVAAPSVEVPAASVAPAGADTPIAVESPAPVGVPAVADPPAPADTTAVASGPPNVVSTANALPSSDAVPTSVPASDAPSTSTVSPDSLPPPPPVAVADAVTDPPPAIPVAASASGAATEDGTGVPIGLGLGGALVLATGAIALLEARRRHRVRSARIGARLAPVSDVDVTTELALRAASAPERLARLDLALRAAALDLADAQSRVLTAEVADDGDIRLVLDGSATPSGATWRLDLDDGTWVLPARIPTEVLAESARHAGMPCPALAHLGSTRGGQLFADLEALGVLHVDVAGPFGRDIVRCLAASMALSPFAATAHVVTVGLEEDLALGTNVDVQQADSLDAALELAAGRLGTTRTIAAGTSTFALRARSNGGEAWEPAIIFAGAPESEPFDVRLAGDGLAVVSVGRGAHDATETDGREWSLCVRANTFVLEPLGIVLTPCGLGQRGVLDVRALLATAEQPLEVRARVVPIDAALPDDERSDRDWRQPVTWMEDQPAGPTREPFAEPPWSLLVRLLGQVDVVTPDGDSAAFERSKALELIVWLSQHRQRPTRTGARTALWNVDVRDATFANVVSDARRAMARALPPPVGEEWLARTLTEELPLHRAVLTDADLLAARVEHARGMPARPAIEVLRPGLELVSGMPFAGTSFLWTDAEGIATSLTLLVVGAATDLANHHLALGDAEGVFWATGQGLKALPGHEELIALRMRAHAGAGDLSGVRHEWEAYERALDADSWASAQPSPKLVALRRDLLGAAAAVS